VTNLLDGNVLVTIGGECHIHLPAYEFQEEVQVACGFPRRTQRPS
jgi:hypothetical protein